jgi:hypothetical protein
MIRKDLAEFRNKSDLFGSIYLEVMDGLGLDRSEGKETEVHAPFRKGSKRFKRE